MKICFTLICLLFCCSCVAQQNGYVPVTAISQNKLLIDHYKETEASFKVYEKILIIQTEKTADNIKSDSASTAATTRAKKYIVVTITEVERSETEGTVTALIISRNIQDTFLINNEASVHLSSLYSRWRW